jgi:Zinc-ribbon, C4HC2 type
MKPSSSNAPSGECRFKVRPGVYALNTKTLHDDEKRLCQIQALCIHNAGVCERIGEVGKQGVWKLLAQLVDRRLNERPDSFNGWGGDGGGALGVGLVESFMKYYEALGDVQMLATMVCVLSGGRPRTEGGAGGSRCFLPEGQDEKYDLYIRRYADLLFGWGLLVKRAELNKHLVRRVQESEGTMWNDIASKEKAPGIALVFTCSKCGNDAEFGTNICRSCQEFAFKCTICEQAVRGLSIVCSACGHGGHVVHMTDWFSKHRQCPSGCGCMCTFTNHPQRRSPTDANSPPRGDSTGIGPYSPVDPLDG